MELFKDDTILARTVDDILSDAGGVNNGSSDGGGTQVGGAKVGGSITGGAYYSNIAGARVEVFPEYDETLGFASYDVDGVSVFKTIIDGTDVGDVIIGDYAGGKGAKWDQSAGTFTVSGAIAASTIDIGGADATSFHVDIDGNMWSGNASYASGPFRVSSGGALVSTSATITGAINATSGKFGTSTNYWSVGATGLTAVSASTDVIINYGKTDFGQDSTSGFILGYDYSASASKFEIGSSATKIFKYDGTDFTLIGGTITGGIVQTATTGGRVRLNGSNYKLEFLQDNTVYGSMFTYVGIGSTNGLIAQSTTGESWIALTEGTNNYVEISTGDACITVDENNQEVDISVDVYSGNLFPFNVAPNNYDLGSSTYKWKDLYLTGNITVGGTVDGYDVSTLGGYLDQAVKTTSGPTFRGVTISSGYYVNTAVNTPTVNGDWIPYTNNNNDLGQSTQYWYRIYGNHIYYKDHQAFDKYDDIALMKNIKMKTVRRKDTLKSIDGLLSEGKEKDVDIWDENTMPPETMEDGFFKNGAVNGLLIGTMKALIAEVDLLKKEIKNLKK